MSVVAFQFASGAQSPSNVEEVSLQQLFIAALNEDR